jgi:hypothetical protein
MGESERECPNENIGSVRNRFCRDLVENYHCVEMKPVKGLPIYQFKLFPMADNCDACLFVKPDSEIIRYLAADTVIDMKYLPKKFGSRFGLYSTQIKSVSKEKSGPFKGLYRIGISIENEHYGLSN